MNLKNLAIANATLTMSSLEIAELTGKEHKNVVADLRKMLNELDLTAAEFSASVKYTGNNNAQLTREIFNLPKRECFILVSGYNLKLRAAIIDRWQELENQSKPSLPTTYIAALEALIASEKATLTRWLFCWSERKASNDYLLQST